MFLSETRLPHVLSPSAYSCAEQYERERQKALFDAWHFIGTTHEFSKPGSFRTVDLFGYPIQIRNFDGEIKTLSNICAHRHCLITSKTSGCTEKMKCQYHGWEYQVDGTTGKIPEPKNFVPYPKGGERIPVYRTETCGQLVFVTLSENAPTLKEHLGPYHAIIEKKFGDSFAPFLSFDFGYETNWKIPIENSLEAYHVPSVHQNTFREDPGDERSTHRLEESWTSFETPMPFSPHSKIDNSFQKIESWLMRRLGSEADGNYSQHHLFPNLMFSFTDAISLVHSVIPTGPKTATAIIRQLGNMGQTKWGPKRWMASIWGSLKAGITKTIMKEDLELLPSIQKGLECSSETGVLGRCEERIHAFQVFIDKKTNEPNHN